jgi:RHS repeat-associated protein
MVETRFLWEGWRLLQSREGERCATYLYDPNETWSPLARVDHPAQAQDGECYWFNADLNGAPLEVTDADGAVRWSGQYGSFGEVSHQTAESWALRQGKPTINQPLRYAGQYADSETGLHYNLFRYYDPGVGRFTTQDPIGLNGGLNLYQYAPNPLGWVDPLGLTKCSSNERIAISRNSARNLLRSRGLNKQIQHDTINSFEGPIYASRGKAGDVFTITEHTPGGASQVYVTRGSAGVTPAERRANLALPPNNSATYEGKVALTRDQILLEGRVAPQLQWGADKVGGGWQVVTAGGKYSGATKPL